MLSSYPPLRYTRFNLNRFTIVSLWTLWHMTPDRNENIEKKLLKVDDQEDYEKSGFKSMMDNVEETKKQALESVP
jgi:hypothetical protein